MSEEPTAPPNPEPTEIPVLPLQPEPLTAPEPAPGSTGSLGSWIGAGVACVALVVGGAVFLGRSSEPATTDQAAAAATTDATTGQSSTAQSGSAANRGRPGGGTSGSITAIDDATFTITATDQSGAETTMTVATDDTTTYSETVAGTVGDLVVGDNVTVMGQTADDGSVTAAAITDSGDQAPAFGGGGMPGGGAPPDGATLPDGATPPDGMSLPDGATPPDGMKLPDGATPPDGRTAPGGGFGGGAPTAGSITAIAGSTITVTADDGTSVTVTTTADTQVSITRQLTRDDLETGDTVRVRGTAEGTTVTAVSVQVGDLAAGAMGGPGGGGRPGGPPSGSDSPGSSSADTTVTES